MGMKEINDLIDRAVSQVGKEMNSVWFQGRWSQMEITPLYADYEVEKQHQVGITIYFKDKSTFKGVIWKEPVMFSSPRIYNYRIKGSVWEKQILPKVESKE